MSDDLDDVGTNATKIKHYWEMTDADIDFSDIPRMSKEELAKAKGRFPNISQQKLDGIRSLVNRQGIEKITRENLDLAKQRWKEAEQMWERQNLIYQSEESVALSPEEDGTRLEKIAAR